MLSPDGGGEPDGELGEAINGAFGSFDDFKEKFKDAGVNQFGSGWAWLVHDGSGLAVTSDAQPGHARSRPARRRCWAPTCGSTRTTSSTRTSARTTWTRSGTSSNWGKVAELYAAAK